MLLQWFSIFSVRSTCKIGDHIITTLNFKCQKNICNLCNLSPKIRPVDSYLKSIGQSTLTKPQFWLHYSSVEVYHSQ